MSERIDRALLVRIRYHEGRFHGRPEWPPSPARLFQAIVSGAGRAGSVPTSEAPALRWLEKLEPPWIGAPLASAGKPVTYYVPNNDLDAKGSPHLVEQVRTAKLVEPRLFDSRVPLLYLWWVEGNEGDAVAHSEHLQELALDLYQLGRGIDPAWAEVEWLSAEAAWALVADYRGTWRRPASGSTRRGLALSCPTPGSLESLEARYRATLDRFEQVGRKKVLFRQPPKALFREVSYETRPERALFELRSTQDPSRTIPSAQERVVSLVERVRDQLAKSLTNAVPERAEDVERMIVGRTPAGAPRLSLDQRVRLIPLPSIGHEHTDRGVRRLLVEIPGGGPLQPGDVLWGVSGQIVRLHPAPGAREHEAQLVPADDSRMLSHYGIRSGGARQSAGGHLWRSVTPAALPEQAARRRLEPARPQSDTKAAAERIQEEDQACQAVRMALRHAGIQARVSSIRVRREPFEARGSRAEPFAAGTRFAKERLWHVEVQFAAEVEGPLVLGDGRFLGLGLMAPVRAMWEEPPRVLTLRIVAGWTERSDPHAVALAFRRAVFARADRSNRRELPSFVTGHAPDGTPAKGHQQVHFVCDPVHRLLLIVPGSVGARDQGAPNRAEHEAMQLLEKACDGFVDLRAGRSGRLALGPIAGPVEFGTSKVWESRTLYTVRRHAKKLQAAEALRRDLLVECAELGLPRPEIKVTQVRALPNIGLSGHARLTFPRPLPGPLLLGRTKHKGGGWFGAVEGG